MQKLLLGCILVALLFEGTITSLPLVLVALIITATKLRNTDIFLIAFIAGVILDVLLVRPIGQTSVYFLIILFLIFLYERKYEVASSLFVIIATFFSSVVYFIFFQTPQSLIQAVTATVLSFAGFTILQIIAKRKIRPIRL